jgi:hypothetical protein
MKSNLTKLAAAGVLTLSATAAFAGSSTQPGITVGASAEPADPGLYFTDILNWGVRDITSAVAPQVTGQVNGQKVAAGVHVPLLTWSTPWQILGGRLSFAANVPEVEVGVTPTAISNAFYAEGVGNPGFAAALSWHLGNGFAFRYQVGGAPSLNSPVAQQANLFEQRAYLSYSGFQGWNLTATAIYGINDKHFGNPAQTTAAATPDFINLDVAATKNFDKWRIGAVGFGSSDLSDSGINVPVLGNLAVPRQRQVALGAFVGYNFGPVIVQTYLTRDVWQQGYGGFDTRAWARLTVPLGDPFAPGPSAMYHK